MCTVEGAIAIVARRVGCSRDEYLAHLAAGEKWCSGGKHWVAGEAFGPNRAKGDLTASSCRECTRAGDRRRYAGLSAEQKRRLMEQQKAYKQRKRAARAGNGCRGGGAE